MLLPWMKPRLRMTRLPRKIQRTGEPIRLVAQNGHVKIVPPSHEFSFGDNWIGFRNLDALSPRSMSQLLQVAAQMVENPPYLGAWNVDVDAQHIPLGDILGQGDLGEDMQVSILQTWIDGVRLGPWEPDVWEEHLKCASTGLGKDVNDECISLGESYHLPLATVHALVHALCPNGGYFLPASMADQVAQWPWVSEMANVKQAPTNMARALLHGGITIGELEHMRADQVCTLSSTSKWWWATPFSTGKIYHQGEVDRMLKNGQILEYLASLSNSSEYQRPFWETYSDLVLGSNKSFPMHHAILTVKTKAGRHRVSLYPLLPQDEFDILTDMLRRLVAGVTFAEGEVQPWDLALSIMMEPFPQAMELLEGIESLRGTKHFAAWVRWTLHAPVSKFDLLKEVLPEDLPWALAVPLFLGDSSPWDFPKLRCGTDQVGNHYYPKTVPRSQRSNGEGSLSLSEWRRLHL